MNQIIASVASDLCNDLGGQQTPPAGFVWVKEPDQYDQETDIVWEGEWKLVPGEDKPIKQVGKGKSLASKWKVKPMKTCVGNCPNQHMEDHFCYYTELRGGFKNQLRIRNYQQKKIISQTFAPEYYKCNHESHSGCTNSMCCDVFWHEGPCKRGGIASKYGDQ